MIAPAPAPPNTRVELGGPDAWAAIGYDVDGPSFEFVRPPFHLDIPLTDDELRGMAAGTFPEQVEAALASATLPPAPALTAADWDSFRRIAGAALAPFPSSGADPDEAAGAYTPVADPPASAATADHPALAVTVPTADAPSATRNAPETKGAEPPIDQPDASQANRDFKVILEFTGRGEGPRQVVIGVGGTGRSESFRCCVVEDWREAFSAVAPAVVEAFFDRCRALPVHPAHQPAPPAGTVSPAKPTAKAVGKEQATRRGKAATATPPLMVFTPQPADAAGDERLGSDGGASKPVSDTIVQAVAMTPAVPDPGEPPAATTESAWPTRTQLSLLFG